jgi:hypothetical protein
MGCDPEATYWNPDTGEVWVTAGEDCKASGAGGAGPVAQASRAGRPGGTTGSTSLSADELARRRDAWIAHGFTAQWLNEHQPVLSYDTKDIFEKIDALRAAGIKNPDTLVNLASVAAARLSPEDITERLAGLGRLRFTNLESLFESAAYMLTYETTYIEGRLDGLRKLGFTAPAQLVEAYPRALNMDPNIIRDKLDALGRPRSDAVRVIEKLPSILGSDAGRVGEVAAIVANLNDKSDDQIQKLLAQPREVIDAVKRAQLKTWAEVWARVQAEKQARGPRTRGSSNGK